MGDFMMAPSTALVSWGLVNLPALGLAPDAWRSFWVYNSKRAGDLGSIWYVFPWPAGRSLVSTWVAPGCSLRLRGDRGIDHAGASAAAFRAMASSCSPRSFDQQGLLTAVRALAAALHDLGATAWRDWLIFTAGELIYFVAIWWHLGGYLARETAPPTGSTGWR